MHRLRLGDPQALMTGRSWWSWLLAALLAVAGCGHGDHPPARARPAATPSVSGGGQASAPGGHLIRSARWLATPAGYRLQVAPTAYGRLHAWRTPGRALREALHAAGPAPLHLSASTRHSLRDQLLCHADFAFAKPRWNLETWRPDVGFRAVVRERCNP